MSRLSATGATSLPSIASNVIGLSLDHRSAVRQDTWKYSAAAATAPLPDDFATKATPLDRRQSSVNVRHEDLLVDRGEVDRGELDSSTLDREVFTRLPTDHTSTNVPGHHN